MWWQCFGCGKSRSSVLEYGIKESEEERANTVGLQFRAREDHVKERSPRASRPESARNVECRASSSNSGYEGPMREAFVLQHMPACFTVINLSSRHAVYQNVNSKRWMGDRVQARSKPTRQPAVGLLQNVTQCEGIACATGDYRRNSFIDTISSVLAPIKSMRGRTGAPAATAAVVGGEAQGRTQTEDDLLLLTFEYDSDALSQMLEALSNEGDVWKGIVQVPHSLLGHEGTADARLLISAADINTAAARPVAPANPPSLAAERAPASGCLAPDGGAPEHWPPQLQPPQPKPPHAGGPRQGGSRDGSGLSSFAGTASASQVQVQGPECEEADGTRMEVEGERPPSGPPSQPAGSSRRRSRLTALMVSMLGNGKGEPPPGSQLRKAPMRPVNGRALSAQKLLAAPGTDVRGGRYRSKSTTATILGTGVVGIGPGGSDGRAHSGGKTRSNSCTAVTRPPSCLARLPTSALAMPSTADNVHGTSAGALLSARRTSVTGAGAAPAQPRSGTDSPFCTSALAKGFSRRSVSTLSVAFASTDESLCPERAASFVARAARGSRSRSSRALTFYDVCHASASKTGCELDAEGDMLSCNPRTVYDRTSTVHIGSERYVGPNARLLTFAAQLKTAPPAAQLLAGVALGSQGGVGAGGNCSLATALTTNPGSFTAPRRASKCNDLNLFSRRRGSDLMAEAGVAALRPSHIPRFLTTSMPAPCIRHLMTTYDNMACGTDAGANEGSPAGRRRGEEDSLGSAFLLLPDNGGEKHVCGGYSRKPSGNSGSVMSTDFWLNTAASNPPPPGGFGGRPQPPPTSSANASGTHAHVPNLSTEAAYRSNTTADSSSQACAWVPGAALRGGGSLQPSSSQLSGSTHRQQLSAAFRSDSRGGGYSQRPSYGFLDSMRRPHAGTIFVDTTSSQVASEGQLAQRSTQLSVEQHLLPGGAAAAAGVPLKLSRMRSMGVARMRPDAGDAVNGNDGGGGGGISNDGSGSGVQTLQLRSSAGAGGMVGAGGDGKISGQRLHQLAQMERMAEEGAARGTAKAALDPLPRVSHDADCDGGPEQQQPQEGEEVPGDGEEAECWHEIWASRAVDPVTGEDVVVLVQHDVTAKVIAERHLALVMETEHRLLEQLFPRHILQYITEDFVATAAAAAAAGVANLCGEQWRPTVRNCKALSTWHPQVTLLFADIKGFTPMCKDVEPPAVMAMLNDLYSRYDKMLDEYGVYKVETIGDCYFVAGGLVDEDEDGMAAVRDGSCTDPMHAHKVFGFAQAMLEAAQQVRMPTTGEPVQIRIGIHSGPVVSGVVGTRMPRFCLFGDTVNTTSRMESTGSPGAIHASDSAFQLLRDEAAWQPTGGIQVKGKGLMQTYVFPPATPAAGAAAAGAVAAPSSARPSAASAIPAPMVAEAEALLPTGPQDTCGGAEGADSAESAAVVTAAGAALQPERSRGGPDSHGASSAALSTTCADLVAVASDVVSGLAAAAVTSAERLSEVPSVAFHVSPQQPLHAPELPPACLLGSSGEQRMEAAAAATGVGMSSGSSGGGMRMRGLGISGGRGSGISAMFRSFEGFPSARNSGEDGNSTPPVTMRISALQPTVRP